MKLHETINSIGALIGILLGGAAYLESRHAREERLYFPEVTLSQSFDGVQFHDNGNDYLRLATFHPRSPHGGTPILANQTPYVLQNVPFKAIASNLSADSVSIVRVKVVHTDIADGLARATMSIRTIPELPINIAGRSSSSFVFTTDVGFVADSATYRKCSTRRPIGEAIWCLQPDDVKRDTFVWVPEYILVTLSNGHTYRASVSLYPLAYVVGGQRNDKAAIVNDGDE